MYSLTFQYFRAILCDRRSASDVTGRDNAYNYFNIKQNTMKKRVHEMELNRSSVQMVLAERFPGYSRASDFNSVISDPQDIMVRGNEEIFMEHGFGVAGLNGCRSIMCAISSDGTACYSGDVFDRDRKWTGRECAGGQSTVKDILRSVL